MIGDVTAKLAQFVDAMRRTSDKVGDVYEILQSRNRELETKVRELDREKRFLEEQIAHVQRENSFALGRIRTLEQVANIKPLDSPHPGPDRRTFDPGFGPI